MNFVIRKLLEVLKDSATQTVLIEIVFMFAEALAKRTKDTDIDDKAVAALKQALGVSTTELESVLQGVLQAFKVLGLPTLDLERVIGNHSAAS